MLRRPSSLAIDLSTIERQYENGDVGIILTDSELSVTQADHGQ